MKMLEAQVARLEHQVRFITEKIEGKTAIGMHLCFYFWCKGSFLRGAHEKILPNGHSMPIHPGKWVKCNYGLRIWPIL